VRPRTDGPAPLVLVTDGLQERRSGNLRQALERTQDVAAAAGTREPGALCCLLLNRFDSDERDDDVAVLAVHLTKERRTGDVRPAAASRAPDDARCDRRCDAVRATVLRWCRQQREAGP
jgi:hypothetical protein